MAVWEQAEALGDAPGSRVDVDPAGSAWVKFLSPKFRQNDGSDFATIGYGIDLIVGDVPATPEGFALLTDILDGAYLTDADGAYLIVEIA